MFNLFKRALEKAQTPVYECGYAYPDTATSLTSTWGIRVRSPSR